MTWESDFKIVLLTPIAFSFLNPISKASYFAILFVHWNYNLTAYEVLTLDGETMTATAPAPKDPHEPSQKNVQTTLTDWAASSCEPIVQLAIESANA
jgi:hypothetical protein